MNTDLVRDILLKAAEDVTQGMWCKGQMFDLDQWPDDQEWQEDRVEDITAVPRCAMGSIAVASVLLTGGFHNLASLDAEEVVSHRLINECSHSTIEGRMLPLADHNDNCLPDDPFEAGQQLSELFRSTAEALQ